MNQKGITHILVAIILILTAILAFALFKSAKPTVNTKPSPSPTVSGSPNPSDTSVSDDDWMTYSNDKFTFQMKYPKTFAVANEGPKSGENGAPSTLETISFTDSNKNRFTLNIYPVSMDPNQNSSVKNLQEFNGLCGSSQVQRTVFNKILEVNGIAYKEVVQLDSKGRNLTDFCFFAPSGNLIVLRNNADSTVIAMKRIISSFMFSAPTPSGLPDLK